MTEPLRRDLPPLPFPPRAVPAPATNFAPAPASPRASPWTLPTLPYVRLRFWLAPERPLRLPELPGSMLRGAFGNALRRAACTMGARQECASCRLRRVCLYTRLFENFLEEVPPPFLAGLPTPPRPYVLEAGAEGAPERTLAAGEPFPFELLLFGQAAELTAYALFAVERMGGAGLGWPRVPVRLERAEIASGERAWRTLFADGTVRSLGPLPLRSAAGPEGAPHGAPGRVRLTFLTPTRIKGRGSFLTDPGPRDLAFAMIRRLLEMAYFHAPPGPGEPPLDGSFRPLLDHASGLVRATARLRWKRFARFSNRQKRTLPLEGFVGTIDLEGDLAPLLPLFESARVLHVGKGATIGLGRVEWEGVG